MKFSKSYEPQTVEPEIYALWEGSNAFKPNLAPENTNPPFSIVMPPPNANGNLHIGHGLTIAVEDLLTRYNRLQGNPTWFIPGADHAGFETWVVYEKALEKAGKTRFEYSREELYNGVWNFVADHRSNMELQLRALGASCDWSALTFTLDQKVINRSYDTFKRLWDEKLLYRGEKLVNFCTKHQTAFADIEVVHKDEEGSLWDIEYKSQDGTTSVIVSTTRPETLLGDTAVAVHPEDERYKDLIGKTVKLPLTDREIPIIADSYVDKEFGTGAVKITPAHDPNDFEIGERHNLEKITVIGFDGKMTENAGKYARLSVQDARKAVLSDLKEQNLLLSEKKHAHSVGHCYKCDSVIEPLLKEQWFINVKPLAERAIQALENDEVKFTPVNKKKVLINYLKNLKDWNISRQIPWGIPIPMFKSESGDWIFSTETDKTEIEQDGTKYTRDEDTFDTWFSSSHWPIVCTNWEKDAENPFYPLNVMETAGDILFAWVARMLMVGLYVTDEIPFREVYLHGLVLDENGIKMSKSKGNVINPMDIISEYGSDALRLGLIANRSAGQNQAFSTASVISGRNLCNKLWNISRFIENLVDENINEDSTITSYNMGEDWIIREINDTRDSLDNLIKSYRFAEALELVYDLIWNKYADWFLESQKLYKNIPLLKESLEQILILFHPFAPFTTETIWQNLSWTSNLLINTKNPEKLASDPISAEQFETVKLIVSEVRKALNALPDGRDNHLTFVVDSLVEENADLIKSLARLASVHKVELAKGLRIPVPNRELFLDIDEETLKKHRDNLKSRILSLASEIDTLNMRLFNPNYIHKAPSALVEETRRTLDEKSTLLEKLKEELTLI